MYSEYFTRGPKTVSVVLISVLDPCVHYSMLPLLKEYADLG